VSFPSSISHLRRTMAAYIISDLLRKIIATLKENDVSEPEVSAERILSHITGLSRADLYSATDKIILDPEIHRAKAMMERRISGEPLAYIIGECAFYNIKLRIDNRVLVPRPETEILVDEAIKRLKDIRGKKKVADIGTGSGNIAISLVFNVSDLRVIATDINRSIIELAESNAILNGVSGKINFLVGELFEPLVDYRNKFDAVISNPPYIGIDEKDNLPIEVRKYEPTEALFAGDDGLSIIRKIIEQAPEYLKQGGFLAMEIGYKQGAEAKELMSSRFGGIKIIKDYVGRDRVVIGSL